MGPLTDSGSPSRTWESTGDAAGPRAVRPTRALSAARPGDLCGPMLEHRLVEGSTIRRLAREAAHDCSRAFDQIGIRQVRHRFHNGERLPGAGTQANRAAGMTGQLPL